MLRAIRRRLWTDGGGLDRLPFVVASLIAYPGALLGLILCLALLQQVAYLALAVAAAGLAVASVRMANLAGRRARAAGWAPRLFRLPVGWLPVSTVALLTHVAGMVAPNHHALYVPVLISAFVMTAIGLLLFLVLCFAPSRQHPRSGPNPYEVTP